MIFSIEELIKLIPQFCKSTIFEQECLDKLGKRGATIIERVKMGLDIHPSDVDSIHDAVYNAFQSTSATILTLDLFSYNPGPWAPMAPDPIVIKELCGKYFILWESSFYGPFLSLQDALEEEFFNVPIPKASISSDFLSHRQVLKIAYRIADWNNEEEHDVNDILVNNKRYKLVNHKLVSMA